MSEEGLPPTGTRATREQALKLGGAPRAFSPGQSVKARHPTLSRLSKQVGTVRSYDELNGVYWVDYANGGWATYKGSELLPASRSPTN